MCEAKRGFGDEIPKQVWNRSLPPPVAETGRRSVGNRRKRLWRDHASFPDRQPNGFPIAKPFMKSSQGAKHYLTGNSLKA